MFLARGNLQRKNIEGSLQKGKPTMAIDFFLKNLRTAKNVEYSARRKIPTLNWKDASNYIVEKNVFFFDGLSLQDWLPLK